MTKLDLSRNEDLQGLENIKFLLMISRQGHSFLLGRFISCFSLKLSVLSNFLIFLHL